MIDIFVLDGNLKLAGVVDAYKSLIWVNRYSKPGDCEVYLDANPENIALLGIGKYLVRSDDPMICRIRKIEIDTAPENGNYLIVTGYDVKKLIDQRIFWGKATVNGNLEAFIRKVVNSSCASTANAERKFKKDNGEQLLYLGSEAGLTFTESEQISYKNVGEKIREYCDKFKFGYRVIRNGEKLYFELFNGSDKTDTVIFSDEYENLASTKYVDDATDLANVALIAGSGEDAERLTDVYGSASGLERYELFADARDIAQKITWEQLIDIYPTVEQGGQGTIVFAGSNYAYRMNTIDIQIVDAAQLAWLQDNYTGTVVTDEDGNSFFRTENAIIADLPSETPQDTDNCTLRKIVYSVYLLNRGAEKIAEHGEVKTFDGEVIPDVTFTYRVDYNLGDVVRVKNAFGIEANARIIEVVEVLDQNGYRIEPTFEWQGVN